MGSCLSCRDPQEKDEKRETDPVFPLDDEVPSGNNVLIERTPKGFGFTLLEHLIVNPTESANQVSFESGDNGNESVKRQNRLEAMDTIFVEQVKPGGSAMQAGLCKGDRIIKVNGKSVLGKTYSEVIALIENSGSILELGVMPKEEDTLQSAYSQDAYQKGNEAKSGNALLIHEPPPLSYPRLTFPSPDTSLEEQIVNRPIQETNPEKAYRSEIQVPAEIERPNMAVCVSNETVTTVVAPYEKVVEFSSCRSNQTGPPHWMEEAGCWFKSQPNVTRKVEIIYPSLTIPASIRVPWRPFTRPADRTGRPRKSGSSGDHAEGTSPSQSPGAPSITTLNSSQQRERMDDKTYREYIRIRCVHMYGYRRSGNLKAAPQTTTDDSQVVPNPTGSQVQRRSTSRDRFTRSCPIQQRSVSLERQALSNRASGSPFQKVTPDVNMFLSAPNLPAAGDSSHFFQDRASHTISRSTSRYSLKPSLPLAVEPSLPLNRSLDSVVTEDRREESHLHHSDLLNDQPRIQTATDHNEDRSESSSCTVPAKSVPYVDEHVSGTVNVDVSVRRKVRDFGKENAKEPGFQAMDDTDKDAEVVALQDKSPGHRTPKPLRRLSYILAINAGDLVSETTRSLSSDPHREVNIKGVEERKGSSASPPGDSLASVPCIEKDERSPPKAKGTWLKNISHIMRKRFKKKPSALSNFGVRLDDCPPAQSNQVPNYNNNATMPSSCT